MSYLDFKTTKRHVPWITAHRILSSLKARKALSNRQKICWRFFHFSILPVLFTYSIGVCVVLWDH